MKRSTFSATPLERQRGPIRRIVFGGATVALFLLGLTMSASVGASGLPDGAFTSVGCPVGNYSCYYAAVGGQPAPYYVYANTPYQQYVSGAINGYQYTDYRYCDDGQVIVTPQGYFCANGTPFHLSGSPAPAASDPGSGAPPPDSGTDPRTSSFSEEK